MWCRAVRENVRAAATYHAWVGIVWPGGGDHGLGYEPFLITFLDGCFGLCFFIRLTYTVDGSSGLPWMYVISRENRDWQRGRL